MSQRQIDVRIELAPGQMLDAGMLLDFAYVLAGDSFPGPSRLVWTGTLTREQPLLGSTFLVDDVFHRLLLFSNGLAYTRTRVTIQRPDAGPIVAPMTRREPPGWDIRTGYPAASDSDLHAMAGAPTRDPVPRPPHEVPFHCAICSRHTPGHVVVQDGDCRVAQRLCSGHTLAEVILASGRFDLAISVHHEDPSETIYRWQSAPVIEGEHGRDG